MAALTKSATLMVLLAPALLSGCATMAPRYERPEAPVAEKLPYTEEGAVDTGGLLSWREVFPDPKLQSLIELAIDNNRDLAVATLNVERARALYRVQRSESLPSITASGAYSRQRYGENASTGFASSSATGASAPFTIERYSASANVSAYELDLFGRVRSLNRQALETYFATDEARKTAEISLVAEVANAYLQLAADRELLQIAKDTVTSQSEAMTLTTQLADKGLGNELDVQRARTTVESARADAAQLEAQVALDENALQLLLGVPALPELDGKRGIENIAILKDVPVGLRSEVLLGRPDILEAEHKLKAANANIGAARAAFFPRIQLTASAGTSSAELKNLFAAGTGVWSFAPSIDVPIFTGGKNLAQLSGARIDRKIAQKQYEKAIETAFREVADALATRSTIKARIEANENLADAAAKTYELSDARFRSGVDDYLSVLTAQQADYSARRQLVAARLVEAANLVSFYRALGGDAPAR